MTLVIVSSIARAVAAICFQDVVMTKMMSAAAAAYFKYSLGFMTCVGRCCGAFTPSTRLVSISR